ncbi:HIT family protein [Candidatus Kaiserbacteria bacterium]|nr:HIT family protein [Candidatus Kaiserbacteria bacterium]
MDTIFTKIIEREIPADIVYEDDDILAFLDINPVNKGHTLVIPKKAFVNIFDAKEKIFGKMAIVAAKLGTAIKEATGADGINLIMNNGEAAGQEVPHAHIHIVPRFEGDESFKTPKHVECTKEEFQTIATQIQVALESD